MNEDSSHNETISAKNDIVVGYAVIPAIVSRKGPTTWVLPNFQYTLDRDYAVQCANRMHKLIEQGMSKRSMRSLH